jgi:Tfp pilus assembly protein PilF
MQAFEPLQRALEMDPNSPIALAALAGLYVTPDRYGEAEQPARRALKSDPQSIAAHYMLGVSLTMQGKITEETAVHLKAAANKFPFARTLLDRVNAALAQRDSD